MLEVQFTPELETLISELDDAWESEIIETLPFPIAYTLERVRQENYAWDFLLKDMLEVLLKYVAHISLAEYLYESDEPDFDVNECLKNFARPMSLGHWYKIIKSCADRGRNRKITGLSEAFRHIEQGEFRARLLDPGRNLKTDRQGLLSSLITARNKLYGHGSSLTKNEKDLAAPVIIGLLRAVLSLLSPLWGYDLVHVFEGKAGSHAIRLRGLNDFPEIGIPDHPGTERLFLYSGDRPVLRIFPIIFLTNRQSPIRHRFWTKKASSIS